MENDEINWATVEAEAEAARTPSPPPPPSLAAEDAAEDDGVLVEAPMPVPTAPIRVVVTGCGGCGKTALVRRFVRDEFVRDEDAASTRGIEQPAVKGLELDGRRTELSISVIAAEISVASGEAGDVDRSAFPIFLGDGVVHCVTTKLDDTLLDGADAVMVVFDRTSRVSFDDARQILSHMNGAWPPVVRLVGTKFDTNADTGTGADATACGDFVDAAEAEALAAEHVGVTFLECSALNGNNVILAFTALAQRVQANRQGGGSAAEAAAALRSDSNGSGISTSDSAAGADLAYPGTFAGDAKATAVAVAEAVRTPSPPPPPSPSPALTPTAADVDAAAAEGGGSVPTGPDPAAAIETTGVGKGADTCRAPAGEREASAAATNDAADDAADGEDNAPPAPVPVAEPVPAFTYEASLAPTLVEPVAPDGVGQMMEMMGSLAEQYRGNTAQHVPLDCNAALQLAAKNKEHLQSTMLGHQARLFDETRITTSPADLHTDVATPRSTDATERAGDRFRRAFGEAHASEQARGMLIGAALSTLHAIQQYGDFAAQLPLRGGDLQIDAVVGHEAEAVLGIIDAMRDTAPPRGPVVGMEAAAAQYAQMRKYEATDMIAEARDLALGVDQEHRDVIAELGRRIGAVQGRVDNERDLATSAEGQLVGAQQRFAEYFDALRGKAGGLAGDAEKVAAALDAIHHEHAKGRAALEVDAVRAANADASALARIHALKFGPIPAEVAAQGVFAVTSAVILQSNQRTETANKMLFRMAEHDLASALLQEIDAQVATYLDNVAKKRAQIECALQVVEGLQGLWVHAAGEARAGFGERVAAGLAELLALKHDLHRTTSSWADMFYVRFVYPAKASTVRHRKFVEDAERDLKMAKISILPGDSMHVGEAEQEVLERKRAAHEDATAMHAEIMAKRETLLEATDYHALSAELGCEDRTIKAEEQFCWFIDSFTRELYPQQHQQHQAAPPATTPLNFSTLDLDDELD